MKSLVRITLVLVILFSMALLVAEPFFKGVYYDKTIIASFTTQAIPNLDGKIDFTIEDGVVVTGLESFDKIAREYNIVNMGQMNSEVMDKEWMDKDGTRIQNIYRIILDSNDDMEAAVKALHADKNTIYATFETINYEKWVPNDPGIGSQWYIEKVQAYEAWDVHNDASDVVIAIIDSGVQWSHEDLQDNIWVNQGEMTDNVVIDWDNGTFTGGDGVDNDGNGYVDDVIGWNFADGYNSNIDGSGSSNTNQNFAANAHGTHVAGCASAVGNNGVGVASPALNAKIMVATCSSINYDSGLSQGLYPAITYCTDLGADILNLSWGGYRSSLSYSNNFINYATEHGALVFAAAGNGDDSNNGIEHAAPFTGYVNGQYISTNFYQDAPADCPNAICVAASTESDSKSGFSDFGSPIDLTSPGVSIYATINYSDGYQSLQGTSMASPVAAGIAALIKSKTPEISVGDLRDRVLETADNIDAQNPDYIGKLGSGRVNLFSGLAMGYIPNLSIVDIDLDEYDGDGDDLPNIGEEIELTLELYNEMQWLDAENIQATLSCDVDGVEITDADGSYSLILAGSSFENNSNSFRFNTSSTLANNIIPFTVTITADAATGFEYSKQIDFEAELSIMQSGWPIALSAPTKSSGLFADLDDDGNNEFIFVEADGTLQIIEDDPDDALEIQVGENVSAPVAIGNIDNDNELEIVIATSAGNIKVYNHDGSLMSGFTADLGDQVKTAPAIADVNGDGNNEIIVTTYNTGQLAILDNSGSYISNFPATIGIRSTGLAVGDINNDGNLEVVSFGLVNGVEAISTDGENISGFPVSITTFSHDGPTIANLDNDDELEILVSNASGTVYGIDNDGSDLFTPIALGGQVKTNIIVADLDNDGEDEFVFGNTNGSLYAYEKDGTAVSNFPIEVGASLSSSPVLNDFVGDDAYEIIIADNNGILHGYKLDGTEAPGYPVNLGGSITVGIAIGDIDGDLDGEIAITSENNYYMLDKKNHIGRATWNCLRGSIQRTGNAADAMNQTPNDDENNVVATSAMLKGNYPNPFNPVTRIEYNLEADTNVSLSVFNVRGQKVKTLISGIRKKGNQEVIWNGTSDNGEAVSSGLYFYRLEAGSKTETKKMVLMK